MRGATERGSSSRSRSQHLAVGRKVPRRGQDQGNDRPDRQGPNLPEVHVQGQGCQVGPRAGRHVPGHEERRRDRR